MLLNLNEWTRVESDRARTTFLRYYCLGYVSSSPRIRIIWLSSKFDCRLFEKKGEKNTHGLIQGPEGRLERGMENGNIKVR